MTGSRGLHVLLALSTEPLAPKELTRPEAAALAALPEGPRRRAWLTGRRALRRALAARGLPPDTSAHRFPSPVASLSHSAEMGAAAVVVTAPCAANGVGVDIQIGHVPDPRTPPFFLDSEEQRWLSALPGPDQPPARLRLWTVKEALFKADPGNATALLRDYVTVDPSAATGRAVRAGRTDTDLRYRTLPVPNGALTVAVSIPPSQKADQMKTVDFAQMTEQLSTLLGVPEDQLTPDTALAELAPDSLTLIEVAIDLQEEYDVVLSKEDLGEVATLGRLEDLLRRRQTEQRTG